MSLSDTARTDLLKLIFQNVAWANIGNVGGLQPSGAAGSFYISLHTANPGGAGNQSTNETSYTNYARIGVVRSAAGWTVAANHVSNAAAVTFAACGATGATITHFGIGVAAAGAGQLIDFAPLSAPLVVSTGVQPFFPIGALDTVAT